MIEPESTVTLFRPVGPKELELLRQNGFARWPPRLPEQPIFYPVTNEQYAIQIAKEWNVPSNGIGFVTRFYVKSSFMNKYKIEKVGGNNHTEWWIPAEDVEEMNTNIVGKIEILHKFEKI